MHVRYRSLKISLPSSVEQQHEIIKFCVVWWKVTTANFSYFYLELNTVIASLNLSTFLEPLAYQTNLENLEFRW